MNTPYENNEYMTNSTFVTDHGENIERMLIEMIAIEKEQLKHLHSLRSYGAVVALVAAIQLII